MPLYTQALYDARELALGRLQTEAQQWGGEGLVGTSLGVHNHYWGEHAVEFLAIGTAVRRHGVEVAPLEAPTPVLGLNS
jgi:uncharacterized protein YbjQ (UPF0145 family)